MSKQNIFFLKYGWTWFWLVESFRERSQEGFSPRGLLWCVISSSCLFFSSPPYFIQAYIVQSRRLYYIKSCVVFSLLKPSPSFPLSPSISHPIINSSLIYLLSLLHAFSSMYGLYVGVFLPSCCAGGVLVFFNAIR